MALAPRDVDASSIAFRLPLWEGRRRLLRSGYSRHSQFPRFLSTKFMVVQFRHGQQCRMSGTGGDNCHGRPDRRTTPNCLHVKVYLEPCGPSEKHASDGGSWCVDCPALARTGLERGTLWSWPCQPTRWPGHPAPDCPIIRPASKPARRRTPGPRRPPSGR